MIYIGIDPGKSGAIAAIDEDRRVHALMVVPVIKPKRGKAFYDTRAMRAIFTDVIGLCGDPQPHAACVIEKAQVYQHDGKVSAFSNGEGYGLWRGFLSAFNIPYMEVKPKSWQAIVLHGQPKGDTKAMALNVATQMWPNESFLRTPRCTTRHDGLIDAICIAEYARRLGVIDETI